MTAVRRAVKDRAWNLRKPLEQAHQRKVGKFISRRSAWE